MRSIHIPHFAFLASLTGFMLLGAGRASAGSFPVATPLANSPGAGAYGMWLMGDGTVLAQLGSDGKSFSKLTPDSSGSYATGTWASAGSMLLQKLFFSSAVLSTGKLVTCGGEYSGPNLPQTETNFCEIYDPIEETSSQIAGPPGWNSIGDSPSAVLPDGTMLLGNTQGLGSQCAVLNSRSLTWSIVQGDNDNEQGYTLLPTGDVLTAELYQTTSMRYSPSAGTWTFDAPVPDVLQANSEIGPSMTLMDGRVIWFGATGHTAIYTPTSAGNNGSWVQGPDLPVVGGDQLVADDVPAILEPNGQVLLVASGAVAPSQFIEYLPPSNSFSAVAGTPTGFNREYARMLLLPNGHGLVSLINGEWLDLQFAPGGEAQWAPTITSLLSTVFAGDTVTLGGTQLSGLSECSAFGDDNQQVENYPTVRIVSSVGGATRYLRAHDVSTRSIAPQQTGTVKVDIPSDLPLGNYSLTVIAMGIPSNSWRVLVSAPPPPPPPPPNFCQECVRTGGICSTVGTRKVCIHE